MATSVSRNAFGAQSTLLPSVRTSPGYRRNTHGVRVAASIHSGPVICAAVGTASVSDAAGLRCLNKASTSSDSRTSRRRLTRTEAGGTIAGNIVYSCANMFIAIRTYRIAITVISAPPTIQIVSEVLALVLNASACTVAQRVRGGTRLAVVCPRAPDAAKSAARTKHFRMACITGNAADSGRRAC